jgi:cytochrome c
MQRRIAGALCSAVFPLLLVVAPLAHAVDVDAAKTLARQSNCFKCHSVDKTKEAPPWKEVAAEYKGKPDASERLFVHITSGEKVKFEDGHEEEHAVVKTKDKAQIQNLIDWILSLQ